MNLPRTPGLIIAYHGCDEEVAKRVVSEGERLKDSKNDYDWLGHGQYFWENNAQRAYDWATELQKRPNSSIQVPSVIGAVIDLGICLDLMDSMCVQVLRYAYENMEKDYDDSGRPLPINSNVRGNSDLLLRHLDCAVIEYLHNISVSRFGVSFDSVRGLFLEGSPIYSGSGFMDKTHVQICITNPDCIRGYFWPRSTPEK